MSYNNPYAGGSSLLDAYRQGLDYRSRRRKEELERNLLKEEIEYYRQKTRGLTTPNAGVSWAEWQQFQTLTPEQKQEYLRLKRQSPQESLITKGILFNPQTQQATQLGGFAQALGDIEATKAQAVEEVRNLNEPIRASDVERAKLMQKQIFEPQIKEANIKAQKRGEVSTDLQRRLSTLPEVTKTIGTLSEIGEDATYTLAGKGIDFLRTQLGYGSSEGAIARSKYIAIINNQILPLLSETFGPQFTENEGEKLQRTLGDPDLPPAEKNAILKVFIDQKRKDINRRQRIVTGKLRPKSFT
jgi:hypothetical protein